MAKKITYQDKVGIVPREVRINQVWDADMNQIKDIVNDHATEIESLANGEGKTYTSIADAMAVLPLPSDNTPFTVRDSSGGLEDGYYIYLSTEPGGYLFLSDITDFIPYSDSDKDISFSGNKIVFVHGTSVSDIQSALDSATEGSVIVLPPNITYTQTGRINIINDGVTLRGNNTTIKRGAESTALTTAQVTEVSTVISVDAVPSDWNNNDLLQVYIDDTRSTSNVILSSKIQSIDGLDITLTGVVGVDGDGNPRTWAIGTNVRKVYSQIDITEDLTYNIEGITFDGNRSNNSGNFYWGVNPCVKGSGASTIDRCNFFDMPNECMLGTGFTITRCYAKDLNGSLTHQSTQNTSLERSKYYAEISNNLTYNTNIEYIKSGHSEGVITFSATAGRTNIHNNYFLDGAAAVLGYTSFGNGTDGGTRDFVFTDNFCQNFLKPIYNVLASGTNKAGKFIVTNNILDNCGSLLGSVINTPLALYDEVYLGGNYLWGGTTFVDILESAITKQDFAVDNIVGDTNVKGDLTAETIGIEKSLPYFQIKSTQGTGDEIRFYSSYNTVNDLVIRNQTTGTHYLRFDINGNAELYKKVKMTGIGTYANDSAAGSGGLVGGDVYKTSTGELRIKL